MVDSFPHHSWPAALVMYGNESTCAEEKSNPRIASSGKDTFPYPKKTIPVAPKPFLYPQKPFPYPQNHFPQIKM